MKTADKHYKFINSSTGYSIYYFSLSSELKIEEIKIELEKVQAHVASTHGLLLTTIYWEEIKDESGE